MAQLEAQDRERQAKDAILSKIPAFPPIVLRALDLLSKEGTPFPELARLIESDATLSAQVLRMANSALFALTSPVETVQHGLVVLGVSRLHSLVLTVAATNYMRGAFRTEALTKCWRHMLASAVIGRELARASSQEPDRAYTLGLIHDIGRLGLLVGYPDAYQEILAEAGRDAVSLLDLEKRRFGMDHCEAGRMLMSQWGLPQAILIATGRHHDPPQGGPFDMLHVVYFACRFADALGYSVVAPLQPAVFEELAALLPDGARSRFAADADTLRQTVGSSIGEEESAPPAHPVQTAPKRDVASATPPGGEMEQADAAGPGSSPEPLGDPERGLASMAQEIVRDFLIVALTVAIFITIVLGLKYLG